MPESLTELIRDRSRAIGAILVDLGRLKVQDVDEIREFAANHGLRFGEAALKLQRLSQEDIDTAIAHQFKYPILARTGEHSVSEDVVAAYMPQSEMVEPLRVLRSQLSVRWLHAKEHNILAVVSPGRGDGRSWLSANLATVFAQNGARVLLIDANMRHPRQHELFKLSNTAGLAALLTGRAGREVVSRIHPGLRLFVMPAGSTPPNPQELLGRQVFDVVVDTFASQFDLVILDTPATCECADAQILAAHADAAVLLVRQNHTRTEDLGAAMQTLIASGIHVVGSVLNEF
jgi:chain length determinant protein tyrosine kinase EpsG